MKIVFVAAVGENGVIGRDNALPWRLKSDLRHFRRLTIGRPVLMGRKTFESLGKPLPRRTNIIVSTQKDYEAAGAVLARTLDAALVVGRADALRRGIEEIMVIGGSALFAALMPRADRLEITHVHASPPGDVFFPPIERDAWDEIARVEHATGPEDDFPFATVTYLRFTSP
jgi:dihydrofolate reductase